MNDVALIAWPYQRVPVPMFQTDASQNVRHVNRHWLALLGYAVEQVLDRPLADFLTHASGERHRADLGGIAEDMSEIECQFVAASGVAVDVLLSYSVERDEAGANAGILGAMMDLTALRAAERAAGLNAALLTTVITHASDAILITEAEPINAPGPRIRYANPAFTAMTGYSADEIMDRSPRVLQGAKTSRPELDRLRRALKAWQPVRVELVNYTKAGTEFDVEVDITPVADPTGTFTHWIAIQRNITARLKQEAAVRQSQKMEAVGQLTGGIAHDFNNLLTAVSGSVELIRLRLGQRRYDEVERYVEAALASTDRAASLTQRLLAFSRRQSLDPRPTDVNRLVADLAELFRRTVGPAIQIETALTDDIWSTSCDPHQLESTLLNLVINARDALPEGGSMVIGTVNVRLSGTPDDAPAGDVPAGEYVLLTVGDSGTGMTPETMARAFDPFFTTKPVGQGTGLGLSMVYGFVRQTEGHVRLWSEPGVGTRVSIYLPRDFGAAAADLVADPVPDRAAPGSAGNNAVVLLVEDESIVRMVIRETLEELGYAVLEAETAVAGLAVVNSSVRIDLLLTDIGLPGGQNGRQLADAARRTRPALKVLFVTGYDESVALGGDQMAPGMQVVTKPFGVGALAERVRAMIGD